MVLNSLYRLFEEEAAQGIGGVFASPELGGVQDHGDVPCAYTPVYGIVSAIAR